MSYIGQKVKLYLICQYRSLLGQHKYNRRPNQPYKNLPKSYFIIYLMIKTTIYGGFFLLIIGYTKTIDGKIPYKNEKISDSIE